MENTYLVPGGIIVPLSVFEIARARAFAELVESRRLNYAVLIECRNQPTSDGSATLETVIFDVEVERPQRREHDIRRIERIAISFDAADSWYPEVVALRSDFPSVPHINVRSTEFPRSLCLHDEPWHQVALHWTPTACIERIRAWLAETAKGTLHQDDQPIEPLMLSGGCRIILPADLFEDFGTLDHQPLNVFLAGHSDDSRLLVALRPAPGQKTQRLESLAFPLVATPQAGSVIRHTPRDLKELHEFLLPCGIDLMDKLRDKVRTWYDKKELKQKKLILIVAFPRVRDGGHQTIETTDIWVFATPATIQDVGVALGALAKVDSDVGYGQVMGSMDASADGHSVLVDVLSPLFDLSRASAATASGFLPDERRVLAVGVGALGSQTVDLLKRGGFGKWALIDEDVLLPHNLARHALGAAAIGYPKAQLVAHQIDGYFDDAEKTPWVKADVIRTGNAKQEVADLFANAELILDFSASISAARHVALDIQSPARRASLFLNPRGTDLVMLAEDTHRQITLDCLEMQYYRAISTIPDLATHLLPAEGRIRYARSCRDVTAVIPNHLVSMFAAIGAKAIRQFADSPAATIRIWRSDPESLSIQHFDIPASPVAHTQLADWRLVLNMRVLDQLRQLRADKLPNETGGVLLGDHDFERKILYVAEMIPSPPDSEEWPTVYIRGAEGLLAQVQTIGQMTDGQLQYVGEWHSHPDRCSCKPSDDDMKVFAWLTENLGDEGKPALMAIVGQSGASAWFLGQMFRAGGWEVRLPTSGGNKRRNTRSVESRQKKTIGQRKPRGSK